MPKAKNHPSTEQALWFLRAEGLVVLCAACLAYGTLGVSWWWFAALFLLPDISMLGYLKNPRLGAWGYNWGHTYVLPFALGAVAWWDAHIFGQAMALIWVAHIGFDRLMGYGLKYTTGFKTTHLGEL